MLFVYGYHNKYKKIKTTLQVRLISFIQRPPHKERAVLSAFKGSMTVEAAMVLPVFLLVICTIIRFFVLMNYQNVLQEDMENTARHLGSLQYAEDNGSKISQAYSALKIMSGKSGSMAGDSGVIGGRYGVSLMQSDISSDNKMNSLVADYLWESSMKFRVVQKCSYIPWIGESLSEDEKGLSEDIVYITKNGTVYHKIKECTYIKRCIRNVSYSQIAGMRNINGGKYKGCERCANKKIINTEHVFITDYGDRYHCSRECNTLKRYVQEVKLSEVRGRMPCTKCS